MPSLASQPNDALYDRLQELERRLTEVTTLRRRPSPGVCLTNSASSQLYPAATITKVTLNTVVYSTAGMADTANSRVIIPSDGVYLIALRTSRIINDPIVGTDNVLKIGVRYASAALIPSTTVTYLAPESVASNHSMVATVPITSGSLLELVVDQSGGGITARDFGVAGSWRLSVERLHDIPNQT